MRSIFFKILLWFGAMTAFSFAAFVLTNEFLASNAVPQDRFVGRVTAMQLDDARMAYESGGQAGLAKELARMKKYFLATHHLVDAHGVDLLTGEDRSELLASAREAGSRRRGPPRGPILFQRPAEDGKYHLIVQAPAGNFGPPNQTYYYSWIVAALILLCYALAFTFANPLRQLRETLLRFGAGELSARTQSKRKDEFGDVGRAFDEMADRIETLLTAERRLLQDVSHELRSPLARLQFAVELARTSGDRQAALDRIKREIELLSGLVSELIQMNQAEGDPAEWRSAPVEMTPLLTGVLEDCHIEAQAKECRFQTMVFQNCTVIGEARQLRRAFENIIRNAIRYSPGGSSLDITVQPSGDQAVVTFRDKGPGVPPAMLQEIFRPFFRVETDRARNSGGMGLGLAIAQRAVRLHHGSIQARNANPGLLVEIRLPLAPVGVAALERV